MRVLNFTFGGLNGYSEGENMIKSFHLAIISADKLHTLNTNLKDMSPQDRSSDALDTWGEVDVKEEDSSLINGARWAKDG